LGKGTGLGLSMVHGLAAQSGGILKLRSALGQGTTAEIWLPVCGNVADPLTLNEAAVPAEVRRAVVLLVDDEELVRRATADMLQDMGHQVLEASSAAAALEMLRERQDVELLVSDYLMPGMRGDELIRKARQARPSVKALLITGYAKLTGSDADTARLSKPFRTADLAREIAKLMADGTVVDLSSHRKRPS
jgi:CheY-like chemotaxis protein